MVNWFTNLKITNCLPHITRQILFSVCPHNKRNPISLLKVLHGRQIGFFIMLHQCFYNLCCRKSALRERTTDCTLFASPSHSHHYFTLRLQPSPCLSEYVHHHL